MDIEQIIIDRDRYKRFIVDHNNGCQDVCGRGDQEAVACRMRPYFENNGRRCPDCPVHHMIVDELGNDIL